jgi:hypothetical protein
MRRSRSPTNSRTYSRPSMRWGLLSRVSLERRPFWHNQRALTTTSKLGIKYQLLLWWMRPPRIFCSTSAEILLRIILLRKPRLSMTRHRADSISRLTAISSALRLPRSVEKRQQPRSQAGATSLRTSLRPTPMQVSTSSTKRAYTRLSTWLRTFTDPWMTTSTWRRTLSTGIARASLRSLSGSRSEVTTTTPSAMTWTGPLRAAVHWTRAGTLCRSRRR